MRIRAFCIITLSLIMLKMFAQEIEFKTHIISDDSNIVLRPTSIYASDLDSDNDIDVLSSSYGDDKISWFENDGNENFIHHTIASDADAAWTVFAIDLDSDGDIDVLSASMGDNKIAWYENDGDENFTTHIISSNAMNAKVVYAIDMNGDNNIDVLSASYNDDKIAWYENDGEEFFTEHVLTDDADGANSVYAIDLDGDNDIDVLSASSEDDKIIWFENIGDENFINHIVTSDADGARSVFAYDLDDDSDLDIVTSTFGSYESVISWFENDGNENFTNHIISSDYDGAYSIFVTDIDNDNDNDVLSTFGVDDKVTLFINDGMENFTDFDIITDFDGAHCVYATDVDDDDDMDVISLSIYDDKIVWHENLLNSSINGNCELNTLKSSVNYPNPFNPSTTIEFNISNISYVELSIMNIEGQIVCKLVDKVMNMGKHCILWDGRNKYNDFVSSGVYYYILKEEGKIVDKQKMVLMK